MPGADSASMPPGSEEVQTFCGGWCQVCRVRLATMATARGTTQGASSAAGVDALVAWAQGSGRRGAGGAVRGGLRFVFCGRVSTEDWQDPVTSRARQREQAGALARGHGQVVAEFFDAGQSRTVAWGRRPQAAALVAQLAGPGRGWDAVVAGEYERAFYGSQYAAMAPLFEHYGVQLWMPEAGGRVDFASEHDEQTMTGLGLSSKREVTRTSIRVRTAMAVQVRDQGRYLGGRPPYGYRLGDAGPHPNKAHAAWGRRARRLEPDPETAHIVRWIFARRLAGHSAARIARALNEAAVPCPSAADPDRNPHRTGAGWTLGTIATILRNPRYTGRQVWNRPRPGRPGGCEPGAQERPAVEAARWVGHLPLAGASGAGQRSGLHRRSGHQRRPRRYPDEGLAAPCQRLYLLAGCWCAVAAVGAVESVWSNGKPAYRCRHGHTTASTPGPGRAKNACIREDRRGRLSGGVFDALP